MRLVVDKQSSWCTSSVDGGVHSCSVAHPDMDTVVSIPASGGGFPVELWGFLQQSCPMLNTCTMPPALAYNEADAVFAARLPSILALAREEHAQCCLERQQARALRAYQCDEAQGFLFARAVSNRDLPRLITRSRPDPRA